MVATVDIGGFRLGPGQPCFLIAEAGVNHNGDLDLARRLVDAAAEAGADAVKFQTFRAERLVTPDAPKADYQRDRTNGNGSQLDMLRQLELSAEAHRAVLERCRQRGVMFLSTPFEEESANFLDALGVCAFKIPSGEVTNLPFLEHVARKGKPLIVSTGMCRLGEVENAVDAIRACGNDGLVLLHCVSNYPAAPEDANLRAMHTLGAAFGVPVGYSDHTEGVDVPLAAVALGACVLEKHFTLDRSLPGPDHAASAEPDELTALFRGVRRVEAALGHGHKTPVASETATAHVARKSLVAAADISCGSVLTPELIAIRRPGTGLPPALREQLVGRTAREDIPAGTLLRWELLV